MDTDDIHRIILMWLNGACFVWMAVRLLPRLWTDIQRYANGYKNYQWALFILVHGWLGICFSSIVYHALMFFDLLVSPECAACQARPLILSYIIAAMIGLGTVTWEVMVFHLRPKNHNASDSIT